MAKNALVGLKEQIGSDYARAVNDARELCGSPDCGVCELRAAIVDGVVLSKEQREMAGILLLMGRNAMLEATMLREGMQAAGMIRQITDAPGPRKLETQHKAIGFQPGIDGALN